MDIGKQQRLKKIENKKIINKNQDKINLKEIV